jgi:hypothetical protein
MAYYGNSSDLLYLGPAWLKKKMRVTPKEQNIFDAKQQTGLFAPLHVSTFLPWFLAYNTDDRE